MVVALLVLVAVGGVLWLAFGDRDTITAAVGPEGGTVDLVGGGRIVFPEGSLDGPADVVVTAVDPADLPTPPDGVEAVGAPVEVELSGARLVGEATIEVPFDPALVGDLDDEEVVFLATNTPEGDWMGIDAVVDWDRGLVTATVDSFSFFQAARSRFDALLGWLADWGRQQAGTASPPDCTPPASDNFFYETLNDHLLPCLQEWVGTDQVLLRLASNRNYPLILSLPEGASGEPVRMSSFYDVVWDGLIDIFGDQKVYLPPGGQAQVVVGFDSPGQLAVTGDLTAMIWTIDTVLAVAVTMAGVPEDVELAGDVTNCVTSAFTRLNLPDYSPDDLVDITSDCAEPYLTPWKRITSFWDTFRRRIRSVYEVFNDTLRGGGYISQVTVAYQPRAGLAPQCGVDSSLMEERTTPAVSAPRREGPVTVRVGSLRLGGPLDPVTTNDRPRVALLGQTGEYLVFSDSELNLRPVLAESWEANEAGDVWTFTLRDGVTFHDGTLVSAADVAATFNGPIGFGNAASAFETHGVEPGNVAEVLDERTVQVTLTRPNAAFPYFVSSDNYNTVILPASFWETYDAGSYEQSFIGSGPWINASYQPGVSAVYVKNENYWGDNTGQPDRMEVYFFGNESAMVRAFQAGELDVIYGVSISTAPTLEAGGAKLSGVPTAEHRQIYMDTSQPPFDDVRVRQAMALMLDREMLVGRLLSGFGSVGNDHPIWNCFPMFHDTAVLQREYNLEHARALLEEAGYPNGFSARLDSLAVAEVEELAQLVQASAAQLGVELEIFIWDPAIYYSDYWLAAEGSMGIVNYGPRGMPHVYLGAPLLSNGPWNASHWSDSEYDQVFAAFTGAPDTDTQRELAGQIQALLWEELPFLVPYHIDFIVATVPGLEGLEVTGMGHFSIVDAGFAD